MALYLPIGAKCDLHPDRIFIGAILTHLQQPCFVNQQFFSAQGVVQPLRIEFPPASGHDVLNDSTR